MFYRVASIPLDKFLVGSLHVQQHDRALARTCKLSLASAPLYALVVCAAVSGGSIAESQQVPSNAELIGAMPISPWQNPSYAARH